MLATHILPVVAIVGRSNVGKSTLFNALTHTSLALIDKLPGATRDPLYQRMVIEDKTCLFVDTAGMEDSPTVLLQKGATLSREIIHEARMVLFLVDAKEGLNLDDELIAHELRQTGKPVLIVINKIDGVNSEYAEAEFSSLLATDMLSVSALHRKGLSTVLQWVETHLSTEVEIPSEDDKDDSIRVAFVGRPNVGKSTLINRLSKSQRVICHDEPGTTRDNIAVPLEQDGHKFTLIDTAGIRKKARVSEKIEKVMVYRSFEAMASCDVSLVLLDAQLGIVDQDLQLLRLAVANSSALVVAINKWDGLSNKEKVAIKHAIEFKIPYCKFAQFVYISALHGTGVRSVLKCVQKAYQASRKRFSTNALNKILTDALSQVATPSARGSSIKLRYAHQGGTQPVRIIIHGSRTQHLPASYKRYLTNRFYSVLDLKGVPLSLEFKNGENPYSEKPRKRKSNPKKRKFKKRT